MTQGKAILEQIGDNWQAIALLLLKKFAGSGKEVLIDNDLMLAYIKDQHDPDPMIVMTHGHEHAIGFRYIRQSMAASIAARVQAEGGRVQHQVVKHGKDAKYVPPEDTTAEALKPTVAPDPGPGSKLTTDPNDPALKRGSDASPTGQNEKYLVLSAEERSKGFIRPVRTTYQHVGEQGPKYPLRDLTLEEQAQFGDFGYFKYEEYPESESPKTGRFWTREQLAPGCGGVTTMSRELAETYARQPSFYGSTYCVGCRMHRPVSEFVWDGTDERVGS